MHKSKMKTICLMIELQVNYATGLRNLNMQCFEMTVEIHQIFKRNEKNLFVKMIYLIVECGCVCVCVTLSVCEYC